MEIKDVKKDVKERKSIPISVRTFPRYSKWMKDNNISPNAVFNTAIEELMSKDPKAHITLKV